MTAQAIVRRLVSPREAAHHLGAPLDFLQRQLQQLGRAEPLAEPEGIGQVDGQRRQVVRETGRGRGVLGGKLTDDDPQAVLASEALVAPSSTAQYAARPGR